MIEIANYVKAGSLKEAYELNQKKSNVVIGGMLWLKMQHRRIHTAIDLSALGLDTIEETPDAYRIGAMVTLRQMEQHAGLNELTCGAVRACVKDIVGVQFRNLATVGGSIFGRFGFSDVLTLFMAVGASVELYHGGIVSVEEFSKMPYERDILVRVIVPKVKQHTVYLSRRNTRTDFPVLTCCICCQTGENSHVTEKDVTKTTAFEDFDLTRDGIRCCIGARPMKAVCLQDEQGILKNGITPQTAQAFGNYVKMAVKTGSNMRGSKEYRSNLVEVLTRRALLQIQEMREA